MGTNLKRRPFSPPPSESHAPVSEEDEQIGKAVVDSAFAVHKNLGPGLLESVYEACFCRELKKRGFQPDRQKPVPLVYDGELLEDEFRFDVLVNNRVLCELKAVETMTPLFTAQLLTYLKLTDRRLGFLINFNVPVIRDGIKRVVR